MRTNRNLHATSNDVGNNNLAAAISPQRREFRSEFLHGLMSQFILFFQLNIIIIILRRVMMSVESARENKKTSSWLQCIIILYREATTEMVF